MSTSFDASRPNAARMYDYWLGGKDNYEADRQAADAVRRLRPNVAQQALENKKFQTRAITYLAGQGVRQFLDVGSGLPTSPARGDGAPRLWRSTHEAAQEVVPDAVVAYVDHDPVAVAHSRALLGDASGRVVAADGDMRDPRVILHDAEIRAAGFDLAAPACVLLACILHFVDAATAKGIGTAFSRALAPGSFLVISVGFARGQAGQDFASTYNAQDGPRIYAHSWEEITALFDDLDLVPPGITNTSTWRPGSPGTTRTDDSSMIVGGVGRRS
jgi:SAM-dependent methyltransferase